MIRKYNRELSGDTITTVGSNTVRIISRKSNSPFNPVAAQYIYEKFVSFGLNTRYQVNNSTCINVIGSKTGSKYPNIHYIICAHYDDYSNNSTDTIPGSDDNGSGMCAVLESARLLSGFNTDYSIRFIAFDEEEDMMIGSYAYVDSAYAHGDSIMGVICMDMIGYDGESTGIYNVIPNHLSLQLSSGFCNSSLIYQIPSFPMEVVSESAGSDHLPFQIKGYNAIMVMEYTFNPYYHSKDDKFSKINLNYLTDVVKAAVVTLASYNTGKYITINHEPVVSSSDTSSKILIYKVQSPMRIAPAGNSPRVYYKINNGIYSYLSPFYSGNDTLKFQIPGQPKGTSIRYYFALQDSVGGVCLTLPPGGSGLNPPGTNPPPSYNYYEVFRDGNYCSSTLPKPITDNHSTADTVTLNETGFIVKATVSLSLIHSNDGDLILQLLKPGIATINLSQRNGQGGQNYTNTIFDDAAAISITQGTPPFTGSFKPQNVLNYLADEPVSGKYIFKVTDVAAGNQGSLTNWCITLQYKHTVGVNEEILPSKYSLSQNYPNPFNSATKIPYSIPKNSDVSLKVYDMLGREVRTLTSGYQSAGDYIVMFNSGNLSSGVYFYRLTAGEYSDIKRMVVIK